MQNVFFDSPAPDDVRRRQLFQGDLFVYSAVPSSLALCELGRELLREALGDDPENAQHHMPASEYAAVLGEVKPKFIHHPKSKEHIQGIFRELRCDLDKMYFDVPKMRSSTSSGYLTTGIAYAWHPHRDTWYSAPNCQINWWVPIYPLAADNAMAFHPRYWNNRVANSSAGYNYYEWNKKFRGAHVAKLVGKEDPRPLPRPTEPLDREPELRLICPVGGVILFSAAQMHSSVPNTSGRTRFSFDFRTVHLDDALNRTGAPNIDAECTGTTMRDYLRGSDLSRLPEEIVAMYDDETRDLGRLVYQHEA